MSLASRRATRLYGLYEVAKVEKDSDQPEKLVKAVQERWRRLNGHKPLADASTARQRKVTEDTTMTDEKVAAYIDYNQGGPHSRLNCRTARGVRPVGETQGGTTTHRGLNR